MEFDVSPLKEAIDKKDEDTPTTTLNLIKNGENLNVLHKSGGGFLHYIASKYENYKDAPWLIPVVFQLSNYGIDCNLRDRQGNTALHIACKKPHTYQLVEALIQVGVDQTIPNTAGEEVGDTTTEPMNKTVLKLFHPGMWVAIEKGHSEETILRLIASWVKLDDKRKGKSLLNLGQLNLAEHLMNTIDANLANNEFVHCALSKDKQKLKKIVKKRGVDVNTRNAAFFDTDGSIVPLPILGCLALLYQTSPMKILMKNGADVNVIVDETGEDREPLYHFVLKNCFACDAAYDTLEILFEKADISLVKPFAVDFVNAVYEKSLPLTIVKYLMDKGLDMFTRDENGYSLRDRIFLKYHRASKDIMREKLAFVDELVINIAIGGDKDFLLGLALDSYDYDITEDRKGQSLLQVVAKKEDGPLSQFVEELPKIQSKIRQLHTAVERGNLLEVKRLITPDLSKSRDKGGRGLLHKAVLFERRFVIKYLLKDFPNMVHVEDCGGRQPLHWATCLEERDIEKMLIDAGASMSAPDKKGRTPRTYRDVASEIRKIIEKEKARDYGLDIFLLRKYLEMVDAIKNNDLKALEKSRKSIYADVKLSDMMQLMFPIKPKPMDLLCLCVKLKNERCGKYLLSEGWSWEVKYAENENDNPIPLEKAVQLKNLQGFVVYIEFRKQKLLEQEEEIRLAKQKNKAFEIEEKREKKENDTKESKEQKENKEQKND